MSMAYKSKALTHMTREALEMVRRERESLWRMKQLLERLRGDTPWIPSREFETTHDEFLLQGEDEQAGVLYSTVPSIISTVAAEEAIGIEVTIGEGPGTDLIGGHVELTEIGAQTDMSGVETADMAVSPADPNNATPGGAFQVPNAATGDVASNGVLEHDGQQHEDSNGLQTLQAPNTSLDDIRRSVEPNSERTSDSGAAPSHSMLTRRRANQPSHTPSPSPSPSDSASIPSVNPWFLYPPTCVPDANFGLPSHEAEETRRCLLLYVQKQEQVVRETIALADGLLKADRLRKDVWAGCKADGHVGELSDGEDWYDGEEWGLEKDLMKGKEEIEEEEEGRRGGRRKRVQRW